MRRIIVPIVILGLIGGGLFFYFFMWDDIRHPPAKTPTECIDRFTKAVKERNYKAAAKYCTKAYAEQMLKAQEAAEELGKAIDNLTSRLKDDKLLTSEIENILYLCDPLPGERLTMTIASESGDEAVANIRFEEPKLEARSPLHWQIDPNFVKAYYSGLNTTQVKLKKEGKAWKLDFPVNQQIQTSVNRLKDKHGDYVNAFKIISSEVKRDATSKEDVRRRLHEEVTKAFKAER